MPNSHTLNGMPVIIDDAMIPATKVKRHLRERKWSHRCRFQKERRFDVIGVETVPNNDMMQMGNTLIMNSGTWARLCAEVEKRNEA